jgi:hypothetical protein
MFRATIVPIFRSIRLRNTAYGMLYPICCRWVIWWPPSSLLMMRRQTNIKYSYRFFIFRHSYKYSYLSWIYWLNPRLTSGIASVCVNCWIVIPILDWISPIMWRIFDVCIYTYVYVHVRHSEIWKWCPYTGRLRL